MQRRDPPDTFTAAVNAIGRLLQEELEQLDHRASVEGSMAHTEIEHLPIHQKAAAFYRHFLPLRMQVSTLLAGSYRRYFKLALARADQIGTDPDMWAQIQLSPAIGAVLNWMREWYILACEGENQGVRHVGSVPFVPGQTASLPIPMTLPPLPPLTSWRAPAWLFELSPMVGIGPLKEKHVPANDSEERLGEAHTRLLLRGKAHCHA